MENNKIITWFNGQNIKIKIVSLFVLLLILMGLFMAVAFAVGTLFGMLPNAEPNMPTYYYGVTGSGRPITLIICIVIIAFVSKTFFIPSIRNTVSNKDERGLNYMKNPTHGDERWMTNAEIEKAFTVTTIDKTTSEIYAKYPKNLSRIETIITVQL